MFTGIVEQLGIVRGIRKENSNIHFDIETKITPELKIDQSVSHNGVCLTVVKINGNQYTVTAIQETLEKTNLGDLKIGDKVNIERCMQMGGRLDGHMVQGHVDLTATVHTIENQNGSWKFTFTYTPKEKSHITVEKGSICVNGVSLTVVDSKPAEFSVAIIPYTFEHTNFHQLKIGDSVNLEFDILGKYIAKYMEAFVEKK